MGFFKNLGEELQLVRDKHAIAEQAALLKLIKVAVDAADDGIAITDAHHKILFMNRSFLSMHGYDPDDVSTYVGTDWRFLYNDVGREFINSTVIPTTLAKGSWSGTITVMKRDGTLFWGDASLTKLQDDLILGVMRDVSERTKAEQERMALQEQLFHTQKMEAIVRTTGAVAEDFDVLLSEVRRDLGRYKKTQEGRYLSGISASLRQAQDLVDQLLAFSHKKKQKLYSIDVGQVLSEVMENSLPFAPDDVTFYLHCARGKFSVVSNESLLEKMIVNLCLNAVEAVKGDSGIVSIFVKDFRYTAPELRDLLIVDIMPDKDKAALIRMKSESDRNFLLSGCLHRGREYVQITVSDSGKGIEPDILPNIFDPFFSTKAARKGTGLGLSTVQGIVTGSAGALVIETACGQGTAAHIFLPASLPETRPAVT